MLFFFFLFGGIIVIADRRGSRVTVGVKLVSISVSILMLRPNESRRLYLIYIYALEGEGGAI